MQVEKDHLLEIVIYSHFFKILNPSPRIIQLILKFCGKYAISSMEKDKHTNRNVQKYKVFAARTKDNSEFRFHIGQLEDFIQTLEYNYVMSDVYSVKYEPLYTPLPIDVAMNPGWELRDYQQEIHDFLIAEDANDNKSRLVSLQTGKGKTLVSLAAIGTIKSRTIIGILPSFMDKWGGDVTDVLNVKSKEVMIIRGSAQLKGLIALATNGKLHAKFVIVSLRTIQNFFKAYELDKDASLDEYGCLPEDLCKLLQVGNMIIDETHMQLHAVFKMLLYTHIPKVIALSATLITEDPVIRKIHHVMFPKEIRFDKMPLDKYIRVFSMAYQFKDLPNAKIRTNEFGSNTYSHIAFEKSVMKNQEILRNYMKLIDYVINIGYIDGYILGDKLIIYAASIAMCNEIMKYLKNRYSKYDIRRYVEEDPYENVIDADIRVTTILSAGTAIDIPGLRTTIMTNSIQSPVANIQTLGRLRKLPDRDVKFYYLFCDQLRKQVDYHNKKIELFSDRALSHKEFRYPMSI